MRFFLSTLAFLLCVSLNAYANELPVCSSEELQDIIDFYECNPTNSTIDAPADDAGSTIGADLLDFLEFSCGCGEDGEADPDAAVACKKLLGKTLVESKNLTNKNIKKKNFPAISNLSAQLVSLGAMELIDEDTLAEIKDLAKDCPKY